MRVPDIIRADKTDISLGTWGQGRVPYAQFPMSRAPSKAYKFGPLYRWRIVSFTVAGVTCRVLILFNHAKGIFRATLGIERNKELALVADHEWHATEPGWHCHFYPGDLEKAPVGARRTHMKRWPRKPKQTDAGKCVASEQEAFYKALNIYRIEQKGGLI